MLSLRHRFHAVTIVLLSLCWLPAGRSFAQPVSHQPVNLSFIYPLSTNRDANVSSNVTTSLPAMAKRSLCPTFEITLSCLSVEGEAANSFRPWEAGITLSSSPWITSSE